MYFLAKKVTVTVAVVVLTVQYDLYAEVDELVARWLIPVHYEYNAGERGGAALARVCVQPRWRGAGAGAAVVQPAAMGQDDGGDGWLEAACSRYCTRG